MKPSMILVLIFISIISFAGCSHHLKDFSEYNNMYSSQEKRRVKTWKEIREQNILMQTLDYSCGAASLATLIHYYFNENINEKDILNVVRAIHTQTELKQIEEKGLSFTDLARISQHLGFQSASVSLSIKALKKLQGPVLVYLERKDYRHFAILRGTLEDRVFLADPSRGNIRLSIDQFTDEWDGRTLILGKKNHELTHIHKLAIRESSPLRNELLTIRSSLKKDPHLIGRKY